MDSYRLAGQDRLARLEGLRRKQRRQGPWRGVQTLPRDTSFAPRSACLQLYYFSGPTTVLLTDLALHLQFLSTAIVLESLRNIKQLMRLKTPFALDMTPDDRPVLSYRGRTRG